MKMRRMHRPKQRDQASQRQRRRPETPGQPGQQQNSTYDAKQRQSRRPVDQHSLAGLQPADVAQGVLARCKTPLLFIR